MKCSVGLYIYAKPRDKRMCLSCAQDISLGFGPRHLISSENETFSALTYLPKDDIVSSLLRRQTGFQPFKEFAYILSGGSKKILPGYTSITAKFRCVYVSIRCKKN